MISAASLSAFAAPIGPSSLEIPPLRVTPASPASSEPSATSRPSAAPSGAMRGAYLDITV
ncbi:hypothetical protein [Acidocella sp. C78]|uniref:hypothetical protein n=1 Tax=Acidocella sp. C78 TaxID=1671486 RepID=UPI00191BB33D|nr:hypothetical protein [Acidocella sp. C78]